MKNYVIIFVYFLFFNSYSQSRDTIYFLINKNDSLIKKTENKKGSSNYYQVFFDKKILTTKNRTPIVEGKVWVADTKYDYYVYERKAYVFNFYGIGDKLINKKNLTSLIYIKNREQFLKTEKLLFNCTIFFIEPVTKNSYIIRKVYPAFH